MGDMPTAIARRAGLLCKLRARLAVCRTGNHVLTPFQCDHAMGKGSCAGPGCSCVLATSFAQLAAIDSCLAQRVACTKRAAQFERSTRRQSVRDVSKSVAVARTHATLPGTVQA